MCFKTNNLSKHDPLFNLNNAQLQYVEEAKYLGVYINKNSTDCDVKRQMRKFYANISMLLGQFHYCSYDVKCHLFNVVCGSLFSEPCRTRIAPLGRDQCSLQDVK